MPDEMPVLVMPSRTEGTKRILRTRWSIGFTLSLRSVLMGATWGKEIDRHMRTWLYVNIMPLPFVVVALVAAPCSWYSDHRKNSRYMRRGARVYVKELKPLGYQLEEAETKYLEHRQPPGTEGKMLRTRGLLHFVKHEGGKVAVYRKSELEQIDTK